MAGRRTWRDELSADRYDQGQLESQALRQQLLEQQVANLPLSREEQQLKFTHAQSQEAKARYDLNKEIETDRQRTAFYNGLQEVESYLNNNGAPIGTQKHAEAFAAYAHEFPLARSSADVQQMLKLHANINDDQAALTQRIAARQAAAQAAAPGQKAELSSITESGEPTLRFKSAEVPEEAILRYGKMKGDVAQNEALLLHDIKRQAEANQTPNIPYNPAFDEKSAKIAGDLAASKAELGILTQKHPQLIQSAVPMTTAQTQPAADIVAPAPNAPEITLPPVEAAPTSHPMEGQTVRNKQSGKIGVITDGQFVPNE